MHLIFLFGLIVLKTFINLIEVVIFIHKYPAALWHKDGKECLHSNIMNTIDISKNLREISKYTTLPPPTKRKKNTQKLNTWQTWFWFSFHFVDANLLKLACAFISVIGENKKLMITQENKQWINANY